MKGGQRGNRVRPATEPDPKGNLLSPAHHYVSQYGPVSVRTPRRRILIGRVSVGKGDLIQAECYTAVLYQPRIQHEIPVNIGLFHCGNRTSMAITALYWLGSAQLA